MARSAGQSCPGFRRVDLLFDWLLEPAVEKYRMVMTAGAPLAALRAALRILHVLDCLAIKLVIEGPEMVGGTLPLVIRLLVAVSARLGIHEKIRRNNTADIRLSRRGEERSLRTAALLLHRSRNYQRVLDPVLRVRKGLPISGCAQ